MHLTGFFLLSMKVSPIIFSTPMVQAILDGSKKQTRISIIDIDPQSKKYPGSFFNNTATFDFIEPSEFDKPNNKKLVSLVVCPYGFKGDLLWVRETWAMHHGQIIYKASYTGSDKIRWKPSIHLKKEDSRIWLRVINVKVERLNRISKHDAIQQGVKVMFKNGHGSKYYKHYGFDLGGTNNPIKSFQSLWTHLHGEGSYEKNPWVFVVKFQRALAHNK